MEVNEKYRICYLKAYVSFVFLPFLITDIAYTLLLLIKSKSLGPFAILDTQSATHYINDIYSLRLFPNKKELW